MKRILILGSGMTGATTAWLLKHVSPQKYQISMWDKSRGAGGRMSTSRCPGDEKCTVDLGAQYISITPEYKSKHITFHQRLKEGGILSPMLIAPEGERSHPAGTEHYITPNGVGSLVKFFLKESGVNVQYNQRATQVNLSGSSQWSVTSQQDTTEKYDCVVLTLPVPQLLQMDGDIKSIIDTNKDVQEKLERVEYSSRFALGLFYDCGMDVGLPFAAKYFFDDSCIRFVSVDNRKRNQDGPNVSPSICVHTSVPFGLKHIEQDTEYVKEIIMEHLKALLPTLKQPTSIKCQKWRYSQVYKHYEDAPGSVIIQDGPLLIAGGDGFTHSNMDGCIASAQSIVDSITSKL